MSTNHDSDDITTQTISHYDENAQDFFAGTIDHDVSQNIEALLSALDRNFKPPFHILDFGCGPGRDLLDFKKRGHHPTGLDGSANFCQMAREFAGVEVLNQNFTALNLPIDHFHGIFANASLFHVPKAQLPTVLQVLRCALKSGGILFCSNPRGQGESCYGKRYGHYMELEDFKAFLSAAKLELLDHYYRPSGALCSEQPWLATISHKI